MAMIKSGLGVAGLVAATALAFSGPVKADEFAYSFTLGATSDYIFRGLSFNNEEPTVQGSIDVTYGQFYAGAWASEVAGAGFEPWELDLYVGYKPVVGQFTFDFGIIGYLYPSATDSLDYYELKAGVSTEIVKSLTGGIIVYYVPDQDNSPPIFTVEGSLAYALPQVWVFAPTISGGLGYTEDTDDTGFFTAFDDSYLYWNAGLALTVEKITFDFRYWDTDLGQVPGDVYTGLSDERFVFTAKVTLP